MNVTTNYRTRRPTRNRMEFSLERRDYWERRPRRYTIITLMMSDTVRSRIL